MSVHAQMGKPVWFVTAILVILTGSSCWLMLSASEKEEEEKDIARMLSDTRWRKRVQETSPQKAPKPPYATQTPDVSTARVDGRTLVGVTLWRLRRPEASDGVRLLVLDGEEDGEWVPERIELNTPLSKGDRVRLAVEAARSGYLYVIDRDQYAEGSLGEPYLIFPSKLVRNGQNEIRSGRLLEIPGQDQHPNAFRLKPSRPDQIGEQLSILITPTALENLSITSKPLLIPQDRLAGWEKQWGSRVGRLELIGGAGQAWTRPEKEAGANPDRLLTLTDPAPQTLLFRSDAKVDEPILVKVYLSYGNRS